MNEHQHLEDLLRERGRELDELPLLSAVRDSRTRAEIAVLAAAENRRAGLRRIAAWAIPLAAAAALLLYVGLRSPDLSADRDRGPFGTVDVEVALLDDAGRTLEATLRDEGPGLPAPNELTVEFLPATSGNAYVVLFGSDGRRGALDNSSGIPLRAGEEVLRAFPLESRRGATGATQALGVLIVLAAESVPGDVLAATVPARIDLADASSLETAARAVGERLGCSTIARRLVFAGE